jgi:hypothetical protein
MTCEGCGRAIAETVDICTCGYTGRGRIERRKRKHGSAGKVRLRTYGRGETPAGRFLQQTIADQTARMQVNHGKWLRGAKRVWITMQIGPDGERSAETPIYIGPDALKARQVFHWIRMSLLAEQANTSKLRKLFHYRANHFRKLALNAD